MVLIMKLDPFEHLIDPNHTNETKNPTSLGFE